MDKKKLLDYAAHDAQERIFLAHVLDKWEQCALRNMPTHTDFLSPAQMRSAQELLHAATIHGGWEANGGYDGAERQMLFFLPDWQEEADARGSMAAIRAAFRAEDALTHRDFLGSLTALGLAREKLGDILVGETAADVIVSDDAAEFLLREWTAAGRVKLRVSAPAWDELQIPQLRVKELRDTVATLRLDAVAATGFSMSRAKASELICAGRVQLNHRETAKPDALVREGDTVSCRGLGKFVLAEVGGLSKKGRTAILVRRYL